jgi:hypothetical protein
MSATSADPTPIRIELLNEGYMPTPVCPPGCTHVDRRGKPCKSGGKAVHIPAWAKGDFTVDDIRSWHRRRPQDSNTGILCGAVCAVDADILDAALSAQMAALADQYLGATPLCRIGRAPKWLRCYRLETPLPKLETPERQLNGETAQVEIMGKGQQVAAYGTHPTTMQPYTWLDREPLDVPLSDLPVVNEAQVRAFLAAADAQLATAGAVLVVQPKAAPRAHANGHAASGANSSAASSDGSFFKQVNRAALANLARWVLRLFPRAVRQATDAYRVASADLGRDYEEDLSIHPDGIRDFGPRVGLSPCDVLMEFGGAPNVQAAALTLCEWLGRDPAEFGWNATPHKSNGAGAASEPPPPEGDRQTSAGRNGDATAFFDPWQDPPLPEWPGGVLSRQAEETMAFAALRDGVDYGAQCLAYLAAGSGAAPKDARFMPYPHPGWAVPPIIWVMVIAESGQRKTAIKETAFAPLQAIHNARWREYMGELQSWRRLSENAKRENQKPVEPHSFIINDCTVEKLQLILATNSRGTLLLKDELAGLFEFGRYSGGVGTAERTFYLESYEGGACTVHRVGRDSLHIPNNALTIYGNIQPDRLSTFQGLESDGLLQRFAVIRAKPATIERPDVTVPNLGPLHRAIEDLARMTRLDGRNYSTTDEGAELIRQTRRDAEGYETITDYGVAFQGFCRKLHGTHARVALVLHLLEDPRQVIIPTETVVRAGRLVRHFLLPHALGFYSVIPGSAAALPRDIGGWLLTKAKNQVVASDLTAGVKACRPLNTKQIGEALDRFVTGGWLEPLKDFPGNRKWHLNPGVRGAFAERAETERARRQAIRDQIEGITRAVS